MARRQKIMGSFTPNMMNIVQSTDLRKEAGECFVIRLTEIDGTRPIVAPFDHRARLQTVRTHLVNVRRIT